MVHKTSFEMSIFNDESVKKKLMMLNNLEVMFDDARNEQPEEYYWFSDHMPLGTRIRVTLEELPERMDAIVRIKEGAKIMQDRQFLRWPNCCPPLSEYIDGENSHRAKDSNMLFCGHWTGKFWNCVADGYGAMKSDGEYGAGSIFVSKFDGVEIVEPPSEIW